MRRHARFDELWDELVEVIRVEHSVSGRHAVPSWHLVIPNGAVIAVRVGLVKAHMNTCRQPWPGTLTGLRVRHPQTACTEERDENGC
jgi:hypothetical protein